MKAKIQCNQEVELLSRYTIKLKRHDLKNYLTGIKLSIDTIMKYADDKSLCNQLLQDIKDRTTEFQKLLESRK